MLPGTIGNHRMSLEAVFVLLLIALVLAMVARERMAPEIVAMLAFGALLVTGVLPTRQASTCCCGRGDAGHPAVPALWP